MSMRSNHYDDFSLLDFGDLCMTIHVAKLTDLQQWDHKRARAYGASEKDMESGSEQDYGSASDEILEVESEGEKSDKIQLRELLTGLQTWATAAEEYAASVGSVPKQDLQDAALPSTPPAKRPRLDKQPVRNAKLCQALACVYNTAQPGQPARADGKRYCIWCDSQSMDEALGSKYKTGRIKQSLVNFKAKNAQVYESALLRLPPNFEEAT